MNNNRLFDSIINNPQHLLFPLLPAKKGSQFYDLKPRGHNFKLPIKKSNLSDRNFVNRMLFKNIF